MKYVIALALGSLALVGCSSNNVMEQFALGNTYSDIKQREILDPDASRRTEGRLNSLDGVYGSGVMDNYRSSTYEPKEARGELSDFAVDRGGSN